MTRSSRKDRKVQRERAQRASDRGLPMPVPEVYKSPGRARSQDASLNSQELTVADDKLDSRTSPKGWFSHWSLSVKVLGVAILVLLGISLWRTIASKAGP
jgi:hypothetical protein